MKVKAIILSKNREIKRTSIKVDNEAEKGDSLYIIRQNRVSTKIEGERIKGTEVILFENHPVPVGYEDNSKAEFNKILAENFIENLAGGKKGFMNKKLIIIMAIAAFTVMGIIAAWQMGYLESFGISKLVI